MNLKNRKVMLFFSGLAMVGISLIIWYSLFSGRMGQTIGHNGFCPRMIPNYLLWLSMILVVVLVVPLSYYFISKNLEEKMEKNLNAITKLVDAKANNQKSNEKGNMLKLLNPNEKLVIKLLIGDNKPVLQSHISRMDGMTKLKAHRTVKELKNKGLIRLEPHGKTNKILINDEAKDLFGKGL